MNGNNQTVFGSVRRKNKIFHRKARIGRVAEDTKITVGIGSAHGAHGCNESLGKFIDDGILLPAVGKIASPAPVSVLKLVIAFKNQPVAFISKFCRNLFPHCSIFCEHFSLVTSIGSSLVHAEPSC